MGVGVGKKRVAAFGGYSHEPWRVLQRSWFRSANVWVNCKGLTSLRFLTDVLIAFQSVTESVTLRKCLRFCAVRVA